MATAQQLEQALKLARAKGYTVEVSPSVKRQSLVENNIYGTRKRRENPLAERLERYGDLSELARPETQIDERLVPQMLKDFSILWLYGKGAYDHLEER